MNELFPNDTYVTPKDHKRDLMDYLTFKSRWWFYFNYIALLFHASVLSRAGKYFKDDWTKTSCNIMKKLEDCGAKFNIEGLDNIRKAPDTAVFVCNHTGTLETMVLPCLTQPRMSISFIIKKKLAEGFFFGPVMQAMDPIVVSRTDPKRDLLHVMSQGKKHLKAGKSVIVFPQSTRGVDFKPENFNTLGIKLASRAGVPVIPVALKTDMWSNGKILRGFGKLNRSKTVYFSFGEHIDIKEGGKPEHKEVLDFIEGKLNLWKKEG